MSHNEYQNQMDYDAQQKKEVEEACCEDNYGEPGCKDGCSGGCCISCCGMGEEEEKRDWWGANNGVITIKYDTQEYMEENFDEWGGFSKLIDSRKEDKKEGEKENGCEVDRCDATGKCTLDKCFYEEE